MIEPITIGKTTLYNCDCMDYMATIPDNYFELAIVDPPYGIGDALVKGGTWSVKYQNAGAKWDVIPEEEYFKQMKRISKNYIVWGGNYFTAYLISSRCFIAWVKPNMSGMHTMADAELALTSFNTNAKVIKLSSQSKEERIHSCLVAIRKV